MITRSELFIILCILLIVYILYKNHYANEKYTIGDVTFKWKNKGSIEGIVDKWILGFEGDVPIDDMEITKTDRPDLFKNFTNNQVQIVDGYTFDSYPSNGLTVKLYYNEKNDNNVLLTKTIPFDQSKIVADRGFFNKKDRTKDLEFLQMTEATTTTYSLHRYDFIYNVKADSASNAQMGMKIQWIKVDDVLLTSQDDNDDLYFTMNIMPKSEGTSGPTSEKLLENMTNDTDKYTFGTDDGYNKYAEWWRNPDGYTVGENIFTIYKKNSKIEEIEISYNRPRDAPGWKIKENSKLMIDETTNQGDENTKNVTYTYTIPKTPIKLDDTVNETWFEWTGNETDNGYFDASVMNGWWVNVNDRTGLAATLKGAAIQKGITLAQCQSLCEKEDECKAVEFTEESGDWETSCALTKVRPTEDNTTTTELERKIWIRPDPPAGPPATDADASSDTTWKIHDNTRFKGTPGGTKGTWGENVIDTFENATLDKCKSECEKNPQCKSFNYETLEPDDRNNCYTFSTKPTGSNNKNPSSNYSNWKIYEQTSDKIVSESGLGLPSEVYIKGRDVEDKDGWCDTDSDLAHTMRCIQSSKDWRKKFYLLDNGDGIYTIKGGSGPKYCADMGNNLRCEYNTIADKKYQRGKYKISYNNDGTYSIIGPEKNKYCASDNDGENIICNRDKIEGWEKFNFYDAETGLVVSSPTSSVASSVASSATSSTPPAASSATSSTPPAASSAASSVASSAASSVASSAASSVASSAASSATSSTPPATYNKKSNTVLWSSKGLDINSSDGTDAGTNAVTSRFYGTVDECKTKCDSFTKCKGFTYYNTNATTNDPSCWLKSSNDLSDTSSVTSDKFSFYYTSSNTCGPTSVSSDAKCGMYTVSENGKYKLVLKDDGNLVIDDGTEDYPWESKTSGKGPGPHKLVMQSDGNLVLYDKYTIARWASNTYKVGKGPYKLVMQNDRNLVLYDGLGKARWASNTSK